jgi:hypothetical protein
MKPSRAGKSIVEVMVIVTLMSVVFAASTTTLAALFRLERQFRRDAEQATTLARLAAQFRTDAHQAASCQVEQDCVLALRDGREIRYAVADREITREVRRGVAVEHRDAFRWPAVATVSLARLDSPGGSLVRLTIRPSNSSPAAGVPPIQAATIDAAIGLPREEQP